MPLEAGETPGPLAFFDIPGVGFSPPPPTSWKQFVLQEVSNPTVVPQLLFMQNLLILKLMWQFVLNRVEQSFSGSNDGGSCANERTLLPQERDHTS